MRCGFKIFDSDTHLNLSAETLEPYFKPPSASEGPVGVAQSNRLI